LHREEQYVGDEEQLDRPQVPDSPAPHIFHGQQARTGYQASKAAKQTAIDVAEPAEELVEEAAKR